MTSEEPSPLPKLRAALVDAARSQRANRQRWDVRRVRAVAVAAAVAVFAVTLGFLLAPSHVEAGVVVERSGDEWVVRIEDAAVRPDAVEGALRKRGITARVEPVPVGPSRVGEFVAVGGPVILGGDDPLSSTVARIADRVTSVHLRLGRAAAPGEAYGVPSDAYAEGEPLECSGLWGKRARSVADEIQRRFPGTVEWLSSDGRPVATPGPDDVVADALVHGPGRLIVAVSPDAATSFRTAASRGSAACPIGSDG